MIYDKAQSSRHSEGRAEPRVVRTRPHERRELSFLPHPGVREGVPYRQGTVGQREGHLGGEGWVVKGG